MKNRERAAGEKRFSNLEEAMVGFYGRGEAGTKGWRCDGIECNTQLSTLNVEVQRRCGGLEGFVI